mmetsp:Transcript_30982/g.38045  ORF Transcript_30982/g.38045 Transcript_30982/m.38045 type:complete len:473 (+) Transcript_30982:28-1446(+)
MSSHHCSPYDIYGDELRWNFTSMFGTCIYNIYDQISFIIGWMSVVSWTFALLPQIITNCKNGKAESQSFYFWLLWIIGDVCNLAGCLLTHNLLTNIVLATVYFSLTLVAIIQFMWYAHQDKQDSDRNVKESDNISRKIIQQKVEGSMSPSLRAAVNILHLTPRMYSLNPGLNKKQRNELNKIDLNCHEHHLNSPAFTVYSRSNELRAKKVHHHSHGNMSPMMLPHVNTVTHHNSDPTHKPLPNVPDNRSLKNLYEGLNVKQKNNNKYSPLMQSHSNGNNTDEQTSLLSKNSNKYGATKAALTTATLISTTGVTYFGYYSDILSLSNDSNNIDNYNISRRLLSSQIQTALLMIGIVLGWLSSIIYISSRIPQLRLMCSTKNVRGLNPWLFVLSFSGNTTQCLSMLINKQIYHNSKDMYSKLPWLLSSGVCMAQDFLIISLIWIYSIKDSSKVDDKSLKTQNGDAKLPIYTSIN